VSAPWRNTGKDQYVIPKNFGVFSEEVLCPNTGKIGILKGTMDRSAGGQDAA
jgi:hypothetical protein